MPALRVDEVLRCEADEILRHRNEAGPEVTIDGTESGRPLYRKLNECNFAALCLSGGGIRSAAFSLGIIQALAVHPRYAASVESDTVSEAELTARAKNCLLARFDYLSTVSGGGYIGSWLSVWCKREGFQNVWRRLVARPDGPDIEPSQIGWLRSFSNYLTPKVGVMSPDAWNAVSIYICNLLLNWLIILPLFCLGIVALKIIAVLLDAVMVLRWEPAFYPFSPSLTCPIYWLPYFLICGVPGVLSLIVGLAFLTRSRIAHRNPKTAEKSMSQKGFLLLVLLPSVLSAVLLAQLLGSDPFGKLFERVSVALRCEALHNTPGVLVVDVDDRGPAKAAGIKKNDVILRIGGEDINDIDHFSKALEGKLNKIFEEVSVVVDRAGTRISAKIKIFNIIPETRVLRVQEEFVLEARPLGLTVGQPGGWLQPRYGVQWIVGAGGIVGALIYLVGYLVGWAIDRQKLDFPDLCIWSASGCVYGALVALAFYLVLTFPGAGSTNAMFLDSPALPLTIGVPFILCSQLLAQFVFVGISNCNLNSDADREWMGRAGGWILVAAIVFFSVSFLTFGALLLLLQSASMDAIRKFVDVWIVPISGLSGIATAFLSKSSLTHLTPQAGQQPVWSKWANIGLALSAPLFTAGLIFMLSILIDKVFIGKLLFEEFSMMSIDDESKKTFATVWSEFLGPLLLGGVVLAAIALSASYFININKFSLHAFYRNRLIRAFLGASGERRADPFTGFDANDNPQLHTLWPRKEGSVWQPFHVIGMTLNLVGSKRRSWQERKAAPFTASALHCGTGSTLEVGNGKRRPALLRHGAYRATSEYGGGISLGTAMAVSGAAASPNMGYHSSPAVTFLMTLLNVRLGWWLGNPAIDKGRPFKNDGPSWAIVPLVQEALGATTEDRKYIYLSDGGHFENLGLYEMVRRRCRFILVIDASCDRTFSFEDLGNAVRKISIDLNVAIRLYGLEKIKSRTDNAIEIDQAYHAVGEIDYRAADGAKGNGIILYIKPAYHGTESAGIRGYGISHSDFPHQSTLNQWFGESQFESYRALGFEIMVRVLNQAISDPQYAKEPNLEGALIALYKRAANNEAPADLGASRYQKDEDVRDTCRPHEGACG